jgi:hypothetical protein
LKVFATSAEDFNIFFSYDSNYYYVIEKSKIKGGRCSKREHLQAVKINIYNLKERRLEWQRKRH